MEDSSATWQMNQLKGKVNKAAHNILRSVFANFKANFTGCARKGRVLKKRYLKFM